MTLELEVIDIIEAADDVKLFSLASTDGSLPLWRPGAHIEIHLPSGKCRQYSLCGPSEAKSWQIAVLNQPHGRGGSQEMHSISVGDYLKVLGPRNHFALEAAERYVFIAGGIGITPIAPMLAALESGTTATLWYGGRSRRSMALVNRLEALDKRIGINLLPADELGLLPISNILTECDESTLVYVCGPFPLIDAVRVEAERTGKAGQVRFELFSSADNVANGERNSTIEVHLEQSDIDLTVSENESILEAVERQGIPVLASCREGTCGTCLTRVLEGQPDHRDSILSPREREAGDQMLICVSRARSTLTIDL